MPGNSRHPYAFEELSVTFHRSKLGALWRWRTELFLILIILAGYDRLAQLVTPAWAGVILAVLAASALAWPSSRRFLAARAWTVITRHRLQRACFEARLHTRAGRLPLILWIRPTKVGARAYIVCRAGTCADDFDANRAEIASACFAREARIIRNRRWSQFVTLDIVRHDPLAAKITITSPVIARAADGSAASPHPVPADLPVPGSDAGNEPDHQDAA